MKDWEEEVAGAVAGEGAAGAIGAMSAGGEAEDEDLGVGIAKGRDGLAPVFPIGIGAAAEAGYFGAVIAKAGTQVAGDDAAVEEVKGIWTAGHGLILGVRE